MSEAKSKTAKIAERVDRQNAVKAQAQNELVDAVLTDLDADLDSLSIESIPVAKSTKSMDKESTKSMQNSKTARRSWFPYGDLVSQTAVKADLPTSALRAALTIFFADASKLLSEGETIVFAGFGSFVGRTIHARKVRVPSTGKVIQTHDRTRVKYKSSVRLNRLLDVTDAKVKVSDAKVVKVDTKAVKV